MSGVRATTEVECRGCGLKYQKRVDGLAEWHGLCRPCHSKQARLGRYVNRKACLGCGKFSPWIKKQDYCQACGPTRPSGENHYNWRGGITSESTAQRAKFLKHTHPKVLARDDYTCQMCDKRGGYLQVDHILSWAKHPEKRFDMDNCRTLCMACHYFVTFGRTIPQGTVWGHNLSHRGAAS